MDRRDKLPHPRRGCSAASRPAPGPNTPDAPRFRPRPNTQTGGLVDVDALTPRPNTQTGAKEVPIRTRLDVLTMAGATLGARYYGLVRERAGSFLASAVVHGAGDAAGEVYGQMFARA